MLGDYGRELSNIKSPSVKNQKILKQNIKYGFSLI